MTVSRGGKETGKYDDDNDQRLTFSPHTTRESTKSFKDQFMEFVDKYLPGVTTPIKLPLDYELVSGHGDKVKYTNATGDEVEHYTYISHDGSYVLTEEFRKVFPHDSIIVVLYDNEKNLYLQLRSKVMRWEPNKLDLASVAAQRRAVLEGDRFVPVDLVLLASAKIAEETGLKEQFEFNRDLLVRLGEHQNPLTNELQTIFAYKLQQTVEELNQSLALDDDPYKAQHWEKRGLAKVLEEYFGDGVQEYAGGAELRPNNFISNPNIYGALKPLLNF